MRRLRPRRSNAQPAPGAPPWRRNRRCKPPGPRGWQRPSQTVEPLFPALTHFERSLEDAARDRVAGTARFQARQEYVAGLARIVFRDPERAMTIVLEALPDQTRFDQMLAPVFASPAGLTATFGELAGTKGWLVPRAERQARAAAERTVARFVVEVRELQWHHAGGVR